LGISLLPVFTWILDILFKIPFLSQRHGEHGGGTKTANTRICGGFLFPAKKSFAAKYAVCGKQEIQTQLCEAVLHRY
jgi:hypothetical protein